MQSAILRSFKLYFNCNTDTVRFGRREFLFGRLCRLQMGRKESTAEVVTGPGILKLQFFTKTASDVFISEAKFAVHKLKQ